MLTESMPLSSNGRVVIPAGFRQAMGLRPGQDVIFQMTESGDLLLTTRERAIQKAQAMFKKTFGDSPEDENNTESFLVWRRQQWDN